MGDLSQLLHPAMESDVLSGVPQGGALSQLLYPAMESDALSGVPQEGGSGSASASSYEERRFEWSPSGGGDLSQLLHPAMESDVLSGVPQGGALSQLLYPAVKSNFLSGSWRWEPLWGALKGLKQQHSQSFQNRITRPNPLNTVKCASHTIRRKIGQSRMVHPREQRCSHVHSPLLPPPSSSSDPPCSSSSSSKPMMYLRFRASLALRGRVFWLMLFEAPPCKDRTYDQVS